MTTVLRRFYGWVSWQQVSAHEFRINQPRKETATVLAYCIFYIVAAVASGYLIEHKPLPLLGAASFTSDAWYVFVFKIGLLLIVPGLWFFWQGYGIRDLLLGWRFQFKSAIWIILAFCLGLSLNLGRVHLIAEAAGQFSALDLIIRIGVGTALPLFMAGIPEEFVYRGILQTRLERQLGRVAAIGITALLFTGWHLPTRFLLSRGVEGTAGDLGSVLLGTGVPVFIVGLIFSILWDRYRSLLPLIAAHWGIDIIPQVVSFLGVHY